MSLNVELILQPMVVGGLANIAGTVKWLPHLSRGLTCTYKVDDMRCSDNESFPDIVWKYLYCDRV
jgi:hypothetical protein